MPSPPAAVKRDATAAVVRFIVLECPFALYLLAGAAGTFLISDDFDNERLAAMAYAGLPLAVLYYASRALMPGWGQRRPRLNCVAAIVLVLLYTSGVVPLINAATVAEPVVKRTVEQGTRIVTRDTRRGGLGLLYRSRW